MIMSDRTTTTTLIAALKATTGTDAPPPVTEAYDETARIVAAARQLHPGRDALAPAVAAALIDGRDPATDPAVQRVLTGNAIGSEEIARQVDILVYERLRDVCLQHADATVKAWRTPFDEAATTLGECFDTIGAVPLEDTDALLRRGGDVADVWAQAQAATKTIETIRSGWVALVEFTRTAQINPDHRVLQLAAVDHQTWVRHDLHRKNLTPWQYLLEGLTLTLPTAAEYRTRVRALTAAAAADRARTEHAIDPARLEVQRWNAKVASATQSHTDREAATVLP